MYAPSTAPLPTRDGIPVQGHFTTFALGYVAFQVFTVDFIAAEQHRAAGWTTTRLRRYVVQCPGSGPSRRLRNWHGHRQHFPTTNGRAS
jgi:hypothetical protein